MNNKGILKYQIISNFDWVIFGLTIIISVVGIFTIYSTGGSGGEPSRIYIKQIYWILYGLMAMLLILFIDYHSLEKLAYILYFVIIVVLIMVAVSGKTVSGARRWLSFAQFTFQPSELAKIVIIITLARYFDDKKIRGLYRIRDLITPAIVVLIPAVLIAKQPDLGTAVVIFFIFISMSFLIGIN
ncbi:MAG TPA: rod shape-determining protein RodA, partial [Nitrospinae bacterium]|nr:rod shape-determining protein RodA [Nitrospinota bacterium]